MMPLENGINHRPRRLNSGLAGEQGVVACHCVAEEAIVRGFSTTLLFQQGILSLNAREFISRTLKRAAMAIAGPGSRRKRR